MQSTIVLPSMSKLSPCPAAYHFLAGYEDGKFVPAYSRGPSPIHPLELSKALLSQLKENDIPSFLSNVKDGGKHMTDNRLVELEVSTLSNNLPEGKLASAVPKELYDDYISAVGEKGSTRGLYQVYSRNYLKNSASEIPLKLEFSSTCSRSAF
ncbi:uncharacterized protein [Elaeis guineensis]|uniref:uncharacterized protein isoform X1 n=1 Tax=Elaeis guineensis var. tenera TaxID=51953 RepID=UPI003C6D91D9